MADDLEQFAMTATVLGETRPSNKARTKSYAVSSAKGCFRSVKNASIAILLWDEDGKLIGVDITGDPSPSLRRAIDAEINDETPPEAVTA